MANFPTSAPSFTNKSAGQTIASAHINAIQDEVVAIGAGYVGGTAPLNSSHSTMVSLTVSSRAFAPQQPRAHVFHSAIVGLASASTQSLAFDSELFDVGGLHSTVTNSDRLTIPTGSSGIYWCCGQTFFQTLSTVAHFFLTKNSSREVAAQVVTGAAGGESVTIPAILTLDAGDILRLEVQSFNSTISYGSGTVSFGSRLQALKIW